MSIEELNEIVVRGDINEFVRVCEARQCKALAGIADEIVFDRKGVRVVLLAGGSSAGKTTTAKRLCTQLRVNGVKCMHFSTDDYFVGDKRNPRNPDGSFDYETIEAVDVVRLTDDVKGLMAGEAVHMRKFDFLKHEGFDAKDVTRLPEDGLLVIEGIHALNPRLTEGIDDAAKYRVFVEPSTQPEILFPARLQSADARLLRRLVRDNQYRKLNPVDTFHMWPKVLAGEEKWINPFRKYADAEFDSSLAYELGVIKTYVGGLLTLVRHREPDNLAARQLSEILDLVVPISPTIVPGDSILRETIGSSQLDY